MDTWLIVLLTLCIGCPLLIFIVFVVFIIGLDRESAKVTPVGEEYIPDETERPHIGTFHYPPDYD